MANIKSQIKRNRQNVVAHERNKAIRSRVRTYVKKFEQVVETGDRTEAEKAFVDVQSELDRAVSKGVMHANTVSRKKARLAKRLEAI